MKRNKLLCNIQWIVILKAAQSLLQLLVGMLSARYLGPAGYGLIHYAASVTAAAIPLMQLGMNATLVSEYVDRPDREGETLGTALVMNLISAALCVALIAAFASAANRQDPEAILICILYSTSLLFQALEMVQHWFQAKLLSKYASFAMLCGYIVVSVYKLCLLRTGMGIRWFALAHSVEYAAAGLLLLLSYKRKGTQKLTVSLSAARRMLGKGRHYILAALLGVVYSSSGPILLKQMAGQIQTGYYSAAVTCMVVVQFVYYAIMDSAQPVILARKKSDRVRYEKSICALCCIIVYLALLQSAVFTVLAEPIIRILYGAAYLEAVPVLRILVWQLAFAYMGEVRNIWILAEGKHSCLWKLKLWGAISSIILNLWLISDFGARGAAAASLAGQIIMNFLSGFFLKDIRPGSRLLLAGLRPAFLREALHTILNTDGE